MTYFGGWEASMLECFGMALFDLNVHHPVTSLGGKKTSKNISSQGTDSDLWTKNGPH